MDLLDASGRRVHLAYDTGVPTVLYYFSPSCRWCNRNWANVEHLAAATRGRYRFVAVTTAADVRAVIAAHRLDVEVLGALDESRRRALGLGGTPQTVVISPQGVVQNVWVGAFADKTADEIGRFFTTRLPGLTPPTP